MKRALVALAVAGVMAAAGCNEGHDGLYNAPPPDMTAPSPADLAVVAPDLAPDGPTCGELTLCAIQCGTDLACLGECGAGSDPREIRAALLLAACAVQSCLARGDGGAGGGLLGGGGFSFATLRCLGTKCGDEVRDCRGLPF